MAFVKLKNRFGNKAFSELKLGLFSRHFENNWARNNEEFRNSIATNYNFEYQLNYFLSESFFATAGIDLRNSTVNSETFGDRYQSLLASYAQIEYTGINNFIINAGVRLDREQTKTLNPRYQFSPKLGLNLKLNPNLGIRASAGGGFRAPQIAERFSNISFQGFRVEANPELIAETSWSAEIGSNYKFNIGDLKFDFDIALFQNHMLDMIEPVFDESNLRIKFINLSEARIRGSEIQLNSFLKYFFFQQAFQIMDPWDLSNNKILKYRSKYIAKSMIMIPIRQFNLQFNYRYFSKMERIDDLLAIQVSDADKLNEAHVVDARLNYNFILWGSDIQASFFANNLLNYYYTQMVGTMAPTRYIGLQFTVSK